jgi:poly(A) polymerase
VKYNLFPTEEESLKREEVLAKLDQTIRDWIKQVGMKQVQYLCNSYNWLFKGLTEQLAQDAGVKLVTFGSYRLGVHSPGGDIDA